MVNEIIEELVQCEEPDDCRALFERLHRELEAHARVEEDHFYPALRKTAQAGEEVRDGREEHQRMRALMSEVEGMEPGSDEWLDTLLDLRDLIEHHVADEEEEMFALAEDSIPEERLQSMGEGMEQDKQRLLQD
jgi:hemerythrin-like domain-containing protein